MFDLSGRRARLDKLIEDDQLVQNLEKIKESCLTKLRICESRTSK